MDNPSLYDLEQRAALARMLIGVIQAATGHRELKEAELKNHVQYGEYSQVVWTEPRSEQEISVEITYQIPNLLKGLWNQDDSMPGALQLGFAEIHFCYQDEVPEGTWSVQVQDECERSPGLLQMLKYLKRSPARTDIGTGELVELILDFIAWRGTL